MTFALGWLDRYVYGPIYNLDIKYIAASLQKIIRL